MSEAARQRGLDVLELVDRAVARGFLPPAPRDKACAICDFRPVCGPNEERRTQNKDRAPLAELRDLRGWA
jgi:ATP-dependent helicase/nuclease subunit B